MVANSFSLQVVTWQLCFIVWHPCPRGTFYMANPVSHPMIALPIASMTILLWCGFQRDINCAITFIPALFTIPTPILVMTVSSFVLQLSIINQPFTGWCHMGNSTSTSLCAASIEHSYLILRRKLKKQWDDHNISRPFFQDIADKSNQYTQNEKHHLVCHVLNVNHCTT